MIDAADLKLLIAVPAMESVPVPFLNSLLGLQARLIRDGVDFEIKIESGTLVYMARDRLASRAINHGFSHVLWLDSDMVFHSGIFEDLQWSGKSFVSGIAHGRRSPFPSCVFKDITLEGLKRWTLEEYPTTTFEVAGCGFACVLIETEILQAVMQKWGTCFTPVTQYGEDLIFCLRAQNLGYKIYAEPTVRLGHVGHIEIWPDDCERYRDEIH